MGGFKAFSGRTGGGAVGQKQKMMPHVETEHQTASLAVPQKILMLELHLHWGFSSDHDKLLKRISQLSPLTAFCIALQSITGARTGSLSTESQVEDILHP